MLLTVWLLSDQRAQIKQSDFHFRDLGPTTAKVSPSQVVPIINVSLARRLFDYCESQAQHDDLPPPPLATNIIADTELDPEDEDSDGEED
jgi:hypothetical protein